MNHLPSLSIAVEDGEFIEDSPLCDLTPTSNATPRSFNQSLNQSVDDSLSPCSYNHSQHSSNQSFNRSNNQSFQRSDSHESPYRSTDASPYHPSNMSINEPRNHSANHLVDDEDDGLPPLLVSPKVLDDLRAQLTEKTALLSVATEHINNQSVNLAKAHSHIQLLEANYTQLLNSQALNPGTTQSSNQSEQVRQLQLLVNHLSMLIEQRDQIIEEQEQEIRFYQQTIKQFKQQSIQQPIQQSNNLSVHPTSMIHQLTSPSNTHHSNDEELVDPFGALSINRLNNQPLKQASKPSHVESKQQPMSHTGQSVHSSRMNSGI